MTKNQTPEAAFNVADLMERVVEEGGEFASWVTVTPNQFGGVDVANTRSGITTRVAIDDNEVTLHQFSGGPAMLLRGSMTFRGFLAAPMFVAPAMINLL